ncbi:hypothetical protein Tco_0715528, partial [Tanacetum coccineum]
TIDSPSSDYVPGPEHPSFPDYVRSPEHPPSPVEVPYVLKPEYPEYLVPSDAEAPLEDQPLPADDSPTALSPGYVADSDPDEDPEEDPKEDYADYPADGGDGDVETYDDDDDTNDEDEEPFEDEDDDEKEEEHLAPTDSSAVPVVDIVPSARDTKAFETDKSAPTPRSPQIRVPFAQTRLGRARKTDKTKTHDSSWIVYSSDCLDLISRIIITINIKNMHSGNSIMNKVIQQGFSSLSYTPSPNII